MSPSPSSFEALTPGRVAVVTGAASGIGLAAARRFARLGMRVVLVDRRGDALDRAAREVSDLARGGAESVLAEGVDVARQGEMQGLREGVLDRFGGVHVLMNNAATGHNPGKPWENAAAWQSLLDVNLWGVLHGVEAFVPSMLEGDAPAVVINTGSKQGITNPPGNPAYNVSKAAVKAYSEALAHDLRMATHGRVSAHLLIPGYTYTGMTGQTDKPDDAWTADQVVDFMLEGLGRGDFYMLCPDNAVPRRLDERRMQWAVDDIIHNRPALSRWHPDFQAEFAAFIGE